MTLTLSVFPLCGLLSLVGGCGGSYLNAEFYLFGVAHVKKSFKWVYKSLSFLFMLISWAPYKIRDVGETVGVFLLHFNGFCVMLFMNSFLNITAHVIEWVLKICNIHPQISTTAWATCALNSNTPLNKNVITKKTLKYMREQYTIGNKLT